MTESNLIDDVRAAKESVDVQSANFQELGARLRAIEQAYRARTGNFSSLPNDRPEWVQKAIETAHDEPGRELLNDARSARKD